MVIDDPTIVYYVKNHFYIKGKAFPPFALAVMACITKPEYLSMEKELLRVVKDQIESATVGTLRHRLRNGINRAWRHCMKKPKDERCPIPLMELVKRAVEILEWVEKAPYDMSCADARRIFWRDMGTKEPFPEVEPPSAMQPTIIRTIQNSPKSLVPMGDILLAACPLDDFSLSHVQYCILKLCQMEFIKSVFDSQFDCYALACDPEEYWSYRKKYLIEYCYSASNGEENAFEPILDDVISMDYDHLKYWRCILNAFERI